MTVFTTPLISSLLRLLARTWLRLSGWRVDRAVPVQPPFVFIGAPHTSNWDFLLLLIAILDLGIDARWIGKHSLFRFPLRGLMRWLGGIPVDRSRNNNLVAQTVAAFAASPGLCVCIPPEGTRSKVTRWRTGFYYIALGAQVPILLTALDVDHKTLRVMGNFHPTGDIARDLPAIQQHYRGLYGLRPANAYAIADAASDPATQRKCR